MVGIPPTLTSLATPLLHIQVASRQLVVTDPGLSVYIGTHPPQVARLAVLRFTHLTPFGAALQQWGDGSWLVIPDMGTEGALVGFEGKRREFQAPPNRPEGNLRDVNVLDSLAHLTEGLNILLMGGERTLLFVPPRAPQILNEKEAIHFRTSRQAEADEAAWRERQKAEQLAGEARFEEQCRQRVETASRSDGPEDTDRHNQRLMETEFNELIHSLSYYEDTAQTLKLVFHPATGKVVAFQDRSGILDPRWSGFPRAMLTVLGGGRLDASVRFHEEKAGQDAVAAVRKLPELFYRFLTRI